MRPCRVVVYSISRDESKNAQRWARSAAAADYRIVLDTGSTDDTIGLLRAEGVAVHEWPEQSFRYDKARNDALALVPDDVDLCVSLDLDEQLGEGFIEQLRLEWEVHGGFDRGLPWIYTHGGWSRTQRVHARHGYRWVSPCHEVHVWTLDRPEGVIECAGTITHHQDASKDRSFRIDLLKLGVEEAPLDARAWWYLARDSLGAGLPDTALNAAKAMLALPTGWTAERAAACRVAAAIEPDRAWLTRGVQEGPLEAEAWYALAKHCYDAQDWPACFDAAVKGVACPAGTYYLTDQAQRAWGLADLAAIAAHRLGDHDNAVKYGYQAYAANPADGRLLENLRWYVRGQAIPVTVCIPQKAGERQEMTDRLKAQLEAQGASVRVDNSEMGIYSKWDFAMMMASISTVRCAARSKPRFNLLLVNNDSEVGSDFITIMAAALRSDEDVMCATPVNEGFAGWCFMTREGAPMFDQQYEWWSGDTDWARQVETSGKRIVQCPAPATHLHPNEATFASPELLAMAQRDEARFAAKWPEVDPSTLFFARNPQMTQTEWAGAV